MTVGQKISNLKKENDSLLDSGEFILDGGVNGILQCTKSVKYENLKSFFGDYPPSY